MTTKETTLKYLRNKITSLNKQLNDEYCDKANVRMNIQILQNAILVIKNK